MQLHVDVRNNCPEISLDSPIRDKVFQEAGKVSLESQPFELIDARHRNIFQTWHHLDCVCICGTQILRIKIDIGIVDVG